MKSNEKESSYNNFSISRGKFFIVNSIGLIYIIFSSVVSWNHFHYIFKKYLIEFKYSFWFYYLTLLKVFFLLRISSYFFNIDLKQISIDKWKKKDYQDKITKIFKILIYHRDDNKKKYQMIWYQSYESDLQSFRKRS